MSSELMSSHRLKTMHMSPPCIGTGGLKNQKDGLYIYFFIQTIHLQNKLI